MKNLFRITLLLFIFGGQAIAQEKKPIDNMIIWGSGAFYPENVNGGNSMNDGEHFTSLDYNQMSQSSKLNKYSYKKYELVETLLDSKDFKPNGTEAVSINDYSFNADETKILIATEQEKIYRYSSKSNYYIYDIKSKKITPLSDFSKGKQRLAEFSPKGNKVAFVRENNLFVVDFETGKETAVTTDGEMNKIIYGGADWVYEEEFAFHKGFHWSPDGSKIAYYRFDEENVKEFQMEMYGSLYPEHYKFKYPKAGEDNSEVRIFVYEVNIERNTQFDIGSNMDIYIPRIFWTNDSDVLCVQRMNRLQNKTELLVGTFKQDRPNKEGVKTKVIYTETAETYIDVHDNTKFLSDGKSFLWTSEKDGFNHIYQVDMTSGDAKQITKGNWEVTEVYGYDEKAKTVYFQAAKNHVTQREVYKIKSDGSGLTMLSKKTGTNKAEFSKGFKYYLLWNTTSNTPYYVTLNNAKGKEIKVLKDNKDLLNRMNQFDITPKEFFTVKGAAGDDLNAWMIKPSNFDENKKYPLLMFVYGGPGSNTVNDAWEWGNYFWWQSLAQKGYIVVSVDARGTGHKGRDFKHSTYLELGKFETEDQIAAAKNLGSRNYIDESRIGIFGWSYGGYMSSLCITKGADTFKAAIAVAPVTNWRYYDNIYTERFMRTPQENGENYDVNSPINHVEKLKGKYLLIHGSADDNVHFRNAMEMVDALQKANKQFDFMAYPNKNHGIYGGYTRINLYDKMTNFLLENL